MTLQDLFISEPISALEILEMSKPDAHAEGEVRINTLATEFHFCFF
jgi:hypothetical protein